MREQINESRIADDVSPERHDEVEGVHCECVLDILERMHAADVEVLNVTQPGKGAGHRLRVLVQEKLYRASNDHTDQSIPGEAMDDIRETEQGDQRSQDHANNRNGRRRHLDTVGEEAEDELTNADSQLEHGRVLRSRLI